MNLPAWFFKNHFHINGLRLVTRKFNTHSVANRFLFLFGWSLKQTRRGITPKWPVQGSKKASGRYRGCRYPRKASCSRWARNLWDWLEDYRKVVKNPVKRQDVFASLALLVFSALISVALTVVSKVAGPEFSMQNLEGTAALVRDGGVVLVPWIDCGK